MTSKNYVLHETCRSTIGANTIMCDKGTFHKCSLHGLVQLAPIYELVETEITKEQKLKLYWGCYQCYVNEKGEPREVMTECCNSCKATSNLDDCPFCGETCCKAHNLDGVCFPCVDEGRRGMVH